MTVDTEMSLRLAILVKDPFSSSCLNRYSIVVLVSRKFVRVRLKRIYL